MRSKFLIPFLLMLPMVALNASGDTSGSSFGDYKPKNFLSDYSRLKPVKTKGDYGQEHIAYRYIDPSVDFSRYDKLVIDRIQLFFKEDADYKGIDPTVLKELADYFYKSIVKELTGDKQYQLVDKPGPGVLHLRIAVTDIVPNKPEASVVSLAVPFLWAGEAGAGAVDKEAGSTPFTGEATVEFEALDSLTSKQVAAYIETRLGKKYVWDKGIGHGVDHYLKAYSTWSYTEEAMDHWAKQLRTRLDELRDQPGKKK